MIPASFFFPPLVLLSLVLGVLAFVFGLLGIKRGASRGMAIAGLVLGAIIGLVLVAVAAISVPAYMGQNAKAEDASTKSSARTAQTAVETYAVDNNGSYGGVTAAALQALEPTLMDATLTVPPTAADSYSVVTTGQTGNTFTITRAPDGMITRTCTTAGEGGCPFGGNW